MEYEIKFTINHIADIRDTGKNWKHVMFCWYTDTCGVKCLGLRLVHGAPLAETGKYAEIVKYTL
jgi:hypothetical protein